MWGTSEQERVVEDRIDPMRALALSGLLDQNSSLPKTGAVLPPLFHHIYFWDLTKRPQPAFWAGGRVNFHAPFCAGVAARRSTKVKDHRRLREGRMQIDTMSSLIQQRGQTVISEEQILVHGEVPTSEVPVAARKSENRRALTISAEDLFLFSGLRQDPTCLHHPDIATIPLILQHLAIEAFDRLGPISRLDYRSERPVSHPETLHLCSAGRDFWVEAQDGQISLSAAVVPAT